jgi:hypothetical protein
MAAERPMHDTPGNKQSCSRELLQRQATPAAWVLEMTNHYRQTGSYRPGDLRRLLGDPTKGVQFGSAVTTAELFAQRHQS